MPARAASLPPRSKAKAKAKVAKPAAPDPAMEELLGKLASLPPDQMALVRLKVAAPSTPSVIERDPGSGGIKRAVPYKDILEENNRLRSESWTPRKNRYYFSKVGYCFLKEWLKDRGHLCDCGKKPDECKRHRFAPGKSWAGVATERGFQAMLEQTYGGKGPDGAEGMILKNIRISEPHEVTYEGPDGKTVTEVIFLVGKSDQMLVGDNLEILNFYEVKSPFYWPKQKSEMAAAYGTVIPLHVAGIEEPQNKDGVCNINQLVQLAAGAHILAERGRAPQEVTLFYVDRADHGNHLEILLTPEQCEILHDFGVWWATEHHINLKSDKPPLPQYFMDWECRNCPFDVECKRLLNAKGLKRGFHPAVIGINERLVQASGEGA